MTDRESNKTIKKLAPGMHILLDTFTPGGYGCGLSQISKGFLLSIKAEMRNDVGSGKLK
jgi:hypothetical protein